ncbi:hypothetical protein BpHYR1_011169 [Brachionus plicatilis]|uniref:Uncharacterized protein n=1 Tax=Brachionus plicatilis TaxID=10195 RepID=A0A3M7PUW0_BRAPC|nr:hypothetical protein BpHYR1_011169 [Brachionus plicatilis]
MHFFKYTESCGPLFLLFSENTKYIDMNTRLPMYVDRGMIAAHDLLYSARRSDRPAQTLLDRIASEAISQDRFANKKIKKKSISMKRILILRGRRFLNEKNEEKKEE